MKSYLVFNSQSIFIGFKLLFVLHLTQGYAQGNLHFLDLSAKESLQATIYPAIENPMHVYVRFDNHDPRDIIRVLIKDKKNKILYRQYVRARKYNLKFNMEDLPNGTYIIKVTNKRTTYSQQIDIKTLYERKSKRITAFDNISKIVM